MSKFIEQCLIIGELTNGVREVAGVYTSYESAEEDSDIVQLEYDEEIEIVPVTYQQYRAACRKLEDEGCCFVSDLPGLV